MPAKSLENAKRKTSTGKTAECGALANSTFTAGTAASSTTVKRNIVRKIIESHLVAGSLEPGSEISIRIDQTLTQDATGTMVYLQFETLGVPRVKTSLSVSYVDHNMLGTGPENADDHLYLQTAAAKYGVVFSRPGNGICHRVHLERFAVPGLTLLGSDSHTPTAGAMCMLAIGAGGLDVAVAMAGHPYAFVMPYVVNARLYGALPLMVSSKDVILEILRRFTVKGGVGKIFEYTGDGVDALSVSERATIANMGAELGLTTSVFPSDSATLAFLELQGRSSDWTPISPDDGAVYDDAFDVDLSALEPMVALPHSPDRVVKVRDAGPVPIRQVVIGSCTNSSYEDLKIVASILKGKHVHPDVSLVIVPGSRRVLHAISEDGTLGELVAAGARLLECACGPCIGMGQAPASGSNSLRTFNRNFEGRSGTKNAGVYLSGPETAAATAIRGVLTDPRALIETANVTSCRLVSQLASPATGNGVPRPIVDDGMLIFPPPEHEASRVGIIKGPNIKPVPVGRPIENEIRGRVLLKTGNDITTDHIMPAGSKILPLRSNIPALSEFCFSTCDPQFPKRAKDLRPGEAGFIVAGSNYGQGSSREHAALVPLYLGIRAVFAVSFARIHRSNLINAGIMPLIIDEKAYESLKQGDHLSIAGARDLLQAALQEEGGFLKRIVIPVQRLCRPDDAGVYDVFEATLEASTREIEIIRDGGLLRNIR